VDADGHVLEPRDTWLDYIDPADALDRTTGRLRYEDGCPPGGYEAHRLGMVSKIFPADALEERTLEYAKRIAELPTVTALLIKESVNQSVDNMGFYVSPESPLYSARTQSRPLGGDP
jgi:hypothetical protein